MRYLILGVFTTMLAGCSHSTTVTGSDPISFSRTSGFAHLEPGGLTIISAGDTLVNFDLVPDLTITNTTDSSMHLYALWSFDSITPGRLNPVATSSDTIDLGTVPSKVSRQIDSVIQVALSPSIAGAKMEYELEVDWYNSSGSEGIGHMTPFDSVPFASRWRGIIYTTEASPTPLGILDGPDDSDWQATSLFVPTSAYPNPAIGATTIGISIPQSPDSMRADLYITPHHILRHLPLTDLRPGSHEVMFDLTGITPGLYRMIWTAYKNGVASTCHGDIMVPLH